MDNHRNNRYNSVAPVQQVQRRTYNTVHIYSIRPQAYMNGTIKKLNNKTSIILKVFNVFVLKTFILLFRFNGELQKVFFINLNI